MIGEVGRGKGHKRSEAGRDRLHAAGAQVFAKELQVSSPLTFPIAVEVDEDIDAAVQQVIGARGGKGP